MKFKAGQEVMVISGVMSGRKATVLSIDPSDSHPWYEVAVDGTDGAIPYLECELEALN